MNDHAPWAHYVAGGLDLPTALLPRRYIVPTGYVNPAGFSKLMTSSVAATVAGHGNEVDAAAVAAAVTTLNASQPTYFIATEFAEAAAMTRLPAELLFSEVNWPLETATFVLPLAFSRKVFGQPVPFLMYARVPQGEVRLFGNRLGRGGVHSEAVVFVACAPIATPDGIVTYHQKRPMRNSLATMTTGLKIEEGDNIFMDGGFPRLEGEEQLVGAAGELTMKLILLMGAEPGLMSSGGLLRKAKVKHNRPVDALWSPNFVGKEYRHDHHGPGGHGTSPRFHFRRGHLHTVLFGPGRSEKRVAWFKPQLINAPQLVGKGTDEK